MRDKTGFSLRRWSQRKLAAQRGMRADERAQVDPDSPHAPAPPVPVVNAARPEPESRAKPAGGDGATDVGAAPPANAAASAAAGTVPSLPPVESLTFDSDFSVFMRPGADETVRRAALRKLLRDPRFNVMDGLDVYVDDYAKPSPIEPGIVRGLMQARYVFAPPKTRVAPDGSVEDARDEAPAAHAPAESLPSTEATSATTPVVALPDGEAQAAIARAPADPPAVPEVPATTPSRHE
ncbi:MAG: DUF3306 domain-containing protein [Rudaea sp.]